MHKFTDEEYHKYKDLHWLMPHIDCESVIERLGSEVSEVRNGWVQGYCPDHFKYTGKEPSHPKWGVEISTGKTHCFTEGRTSNIVFTVARVIDCSAEDAVRWISGDGGIDIHRLRIQGLLSDLRGEGKKEEEKEEVSLYTVVDLLENGRMMDSGYDFFMNPPGKRPTNIARSTVDFFSVKQCEYGYYKDRVVIPFYSCFDSNEIIGYNAIDILGKKEWLKRNFDAVDDDYSKTLYPANFNPKNFLFNYNEIPQNPEYIIITEGPREVMKLWQEGFPCSVAVLSVKLHGGQLRLLAKKNPKKLYIMMDGDEAGWNANRVIAKKLKSLFDVYVCTLIGVDPKVLNREMIQREMKTSEKVN